MAKFGRFDARNKKKGKHKNFSREEKDFRIRKVETKRKPRITNTVLKNYNDYIDTSEEI